MAFSHLFSKLSDGLAKTREAFVSRLQSVLSLHRTIDADALEQIQEILLSADVGVVTSELLVENLRRRVRETNPDSTDDVVTIIKQQMRSLLSTPQTSLSVESTRANENPHVVMIVGINGVGKTTSVGKLAFHYRNLGRRVVIGAADTFRAAANEQLEVWASRAGVEIIQQGRGADPAAVAFDTLSSAISKKADLVLIDTAGRLHTKTNLMEELRKIRRVLAKRLPGAPHETLLVLDAGTGQNGLQQAKQFSGAVDITGIVLTKCDGTAKGGIVFAISNELKIPVRFIGVGEGIDDLQPFDANRFLDALFESATIRTEVA
jgi:fused signal recognition particle receptor